MFKQYVNRMFTYHFTIIVITVDFNIRDVQNSPLPKFSRNCSLCFHLIFDIVSDLGLRLYSYTFNFIYGNLHLNLAYGTIFRLFYIILVCLCFPQKFFDFIITQKAIFFQNSSINLLLPNGIFQIKIAVFNVALLGTL